MAKGTRFVCQQCGYDSPKWMGQCPNCGQWNSMVETMVLNREKGKGKRGKEGKIELIRLADVKKADFEKRTSTGIGELDRVLGGGIVLGMVTLVAGEPGIGKSTLLLQIADKIGTRQQALGSRGKKEKIEESSASVLYVAGEESATQIAGRAARLGVKGENIRILEETDVDGAISQISQMGQISLVIVDSIQTLTTSDLTGTAGSVGQVRECAGRLASWAKRAGVPVFIVGHVTKEGAIAGPRVLEHMVDTVLWFEGERSQFLRVLRAVKNRFGPTDEVGIFSMEEKGLVEISNPSELFLGEQKEVSGSVVASVLEGTRPILVEIQALVVVTKLAFPKRSASGIDPRRLEIIVAVLGRRVGIPLWDYDVFVNVAGGIKVGEPAADLAIALAIASAFYDKPVRGMERGREGVVAIGEIGLLGEVREAMQTARRLKEAKRLGFGCVITSREISSVAQVVKKYVSG